MLDAYDRKRGSQRALAALFGVSRAFLEQLLRRRRTTGEIAPRPHAGGRQPRCDAAALALVRQWVWEQPDATREELCARLQRQRGLRLSGGHQVPCPPAPGAPAKKKALHAAERDTPQVEQARTAFQHRTAALDLRRLKFVDEASVNLALTRLYGRAPPRRAGPWHGPPELSGKFTLLGALGVEGLQAVMTVEGATDTDVFRTYVRRCSGPPWPRAISSCWTTCQSTKSRASSKRWPGTGLGCSLPPYSPDFVAHGAVPESGQDGLARGESPYASGPETAPQQVMETVTAIDATPGSDIVAMPYSHVKTDLEYHPVNAAY